MFLITCTHTLTHTRRLIYTSRSRVISRTFKGFWKVYEWDSFVEGQAKFGERATHRLGKTVLHKNINPSGSPYYSDHVRSSHNVIFCTFECSYSSVLRCILLKLHILTRLIESFPTLYGLWSCIEIKLSIPLGAHA